MSEPTVPARAHKNVPIPTMAERNEAQNAVNTALSDLCLAERTYFDAQRHADNAQDKLHAARLDLMTKSQHLGAMRLANGEMVK